MTRSSYHLHTLHASVRSGLSDRQAKEPPLHWDPVHMLTWHGNLKDRLAPVFSFAGAHAQNYTGPVLFFQKDKIQARMAQLRDLETQFGAAFLMATKSTRLPVLYELGKTHLAGFDVSNYNEYQALPQDLREKKVFVTAPVFPQRPEAFLTKGNKLCLILDNADQYAQLQHVDGAFDFGVRLESSALLKPQDGVGPCYYPHTRFGFSPKGLDMLKTMAKGGPHRFCGFHVHHGSEVNTPEAYLMLAREIVHLARALNLKLEYLDLGGGIHLLFKELPQLLQDLRTFVPSETTLVFEPGQFLAHGSVYALGRIESVISRPDAIYCNLDLSAECHLRWSYPRLIAPLIRGAHKPLRMRCFGATCSESDVIGDFSFAVPDPQHPPFARGDLLLFSNVSSYSEAWNTSFNGIKKADVVVH